jgi:hypothetical protein
VRLPHGWRTVVCRTAAVVGEEIGAALSRVFCGHNRGIHVGNDAPIRDALGSLKVIHLLLPLGNGGRVDE